MSSFFSRIQNYFVSKNTGRYIGIILLEIINEDPEVLIHLFDNGKELSKNVKAKRWKPLIEWGFHSDNAFKNRKADLVIVNCEDERECHAMLEVKAEDKEQIEQFSDYQKYISEQKNKRDIGFTVFSKYFESGGVPVEVSNSYKTITYAQFAQSLISKKTNRHPAINLFIDYVQDMGLMFNNVNQKAISMMLRKFFHKRKGSGRIVGLENIKNVIPDTFSSVIANQFVISEQLSPLFIGFGRSSVDFSTELNFDEKKNVNKDSLEKCGGQLNTFTRVTLIATTTDWLYLYYGLTYEIKDNKVVISAFAEITGKEMKAVTEDNDRIIGEYGKPISFSINYKLDKLIILIKKKIDFIVSQGLNMSKMPSCYKVELKKLKKRC